MASSRALSETAHTSPQVLAVRPAPAAVTLRRNLLVFGLGGLLLPFPFIKLIDVVISGLGLVS